MHKGTIVTASTALIALSLAACEVKQAEPAADQAIAPATDNASAPANTATAPTDQTPLAKQATDPALQWGACPSPLPQGCEIAVLHGDPAKPNSDIFLRLPGGYEIPPHSHTSAERMILVAGRLDVKYRGAAPATLEPGTYAYGPAALPHRATCSSTEPCLLFIAFEGPVDVQPYEGTLD